ncbi:hypothetical protein FQA39_LY01314 [Lamprigera yunnana]|nr:hypothetical protein FQA39_LY01314 [Lamprigera yunnana]
MATPLCKITVMKLYEDIIDDVIKGVQELFLEDGVDENVLQELKETWKTKLLATKAVHNSKSAEVKDMSKPVSVIQSQPLLLKQDVKTLPQNNNNQIPQVVPNALVPIQITLPAQPGCEVGQKITIQVPVSSLQENHLQKVLTGPLIAATMSLPPQIAASVLQQHVTAGLKSLEQTNLVHPTTLIQTDGACDDEPAMTLSSVQVDGPQDSSDDEISEESADLDDDKDEEEDEIDGGGPEEDPLNSDDDISEEEATDVVDTDNVIVCQFDKITRARNKWKFHLKDGIMNINGEDYVFQKANGDAEWFSDSKDFDLLEFYLTGYVTKNNFKRYADFAVETSTF